MNGESVDEVPEKDCLGTREWQKAQRWATGSTRRMPSGSIPASATKDWEQFVLKVASREALTKLEAEEKLKTRGKAIIPLHALYYAVPNALLMFPTYFGVFSYFYQEFSDFPHNFSLLILRATNIYLGRIVGFPNHRDLWPRRAIPIPCAGNNFDHALQRHHGNFRCSDGLASGQHPNIRIPALVITGHPASTPFSMATTRHNFYDLLYHVVPKSIGGKAWGNSDQYLSVYYSKWANTSFGLLSPCITWAWHAVQRKIVSRPDLDGPRFSDALEIARRHITAVGTRMQGCALAALLNHDLQKYLRRIQENWIAQGRSTSNFGPQAISAEDWVNMWIADSTCISAHGYEGPNVYAQRKVGAFVGLMLCNTHDLLYDAATSNQMSVMYAATAGITKANLHCIFITSYVDRIGRRLCNAPSEEEVIFGDNALLTIAAWACFCERYRACERFIKYSRQIACSSSAEAMNISEHASRQFVLTDCNLADVSAMWGKLTVNTSHHATTPQLGIAYHPAAAPEMTTIVLPEICAQCIVPIQKVLHAYAADSIFAVEGLPAGVVECRAMAIAAAIRRAAIFATGEGCCDVCTCRCWADLASYRVLTALMNDEKHTPSVHWLL
ncbi:hypothetical protein DFH08DRAFT_1013206 [Mycena albidolilacea]|uniref:Uncharacterized protein n=1 Tax=Mycena albidolilacea TaxID=1033008 RepID=A0AAD7EMA7_9AGAR|nr:hypothetical protein DFH08DRAFT_1013206 [Mycena albidolilacea]